MGDCPPKPESFTRPVPDAPGSINEYISSPNRRIRAWVDDCLRPYIFFPSNGFQDRKPQNPMVKVPLDASVQHIAIEHHRKHWSIQRSTVTTNPHIHRATYTTLLRDIALFVQTAQITSIGFFIGANAMIVVIPTNRSVQLESLGPLIDSGARFIIVDDSEGSVRVKHPQFQVYNWSDRRRMLGALDIGIPRRNGACRDLGFLIAWRESNDDELIVALDDDCVVEDADFEQNVSCALIEGPARQATGTGPFFNIIDMYDGVDGTWIFPRGFPYSLRAAYKSFSFDPVERQPAAFHLGLWKEVFDINGIDKLYLDQWSFPDARLSVDGALIPSGVWLCLCSMNMQFRRQLIPAVYQLPMRVESSPGMHIDRYGDIWGGFILKMLMDIKGDRLSVGAPMIRHLKDGNVERNTLQEHLAHLVNDEFINLLRVAGSKIRPASYHEMMTHLMEELQTRREKCSPILKSYLDHLCTALHAWLALLNDR